MTTWLLYCLRPPPHFFGSAAVISSVITQLLERYYDIGGNEAKRCPNDWHWPSVVRQYDIDNYNLK